MRCRMGVKSMSLVDVVLIASLPHAYGQDAMCPRRLTKLSPTSTRSAARMGSTALAERRQLHT